MISTTGEIPIGLYRTKYQDKNEYTQVSQALFLNQFNANNLFWDLNLINWNDLETRSHGNKNKNLDSIHRKVFLGKFAISEILNAQFLMKSVY